MRLWDNALSTYTYGDILGNGGGVFQFIGFFLPGRFREIGRVQPPPDFSTQPANFIAHCPGFMPNWRAASATESASPAK